MTFFNDTYQLLLRHIRTTLRIPIWIFVTLVLGAVFLALQLSVWQSVAASGLRIGADPLGGASVAYWGEIAERLGLDLTVVNPLVDPRWGFMTLDWDEKIRMDCSSPSAMASLISRKDEYAIATGNDADADRHGIVTPDAGLMNPNHFLAAAIHYLFGARGGWPADRCSKSRCSMQALRACWNRACSA